MADKKVPQKKIRITSWNEFKEEQRQEKLKNSSTKTKETPLYVKKEESTKYFIKDGFFTAIKSGFTENFVMPFAIALNATTGMLSILSSVPQLLGSFLQLFSQDSLKFFKTRKNLMVWTAALQALMWLPLLFIPIVASGNVPLIFTLLLIFVTLEHVLGAFQGPIFNSVLGDIIDEDKRGEFFGKRNRIVNLIGFISTLLAGVILNWFKGFDTVGTSHYIFFGFAILFFIAFVSRSIAAYYKSKIYDPPYAPPKNNVSFFSFLKNMTHNNYGMFVLFVFTFRLVAFISAPFFAFYLLKDMGLSYFYFTMIIGASIVGSFLAMGMWGKLIDKRGSKFVLTLSGFLIPLSPLLLFLAIYIKDPMALFIYLLLEEFFSGAAWAAFNLSTSSFLFDATSKEERVKYIAYYNFLGGIAMFLGAVLGGFLIKDYPKLLILASGVLSAIPVIYITTGILRLTVVIIFMKKVRECRMIEVDLPGRGFFHSVVAIHPRNHTQLEIMGTYCDGENCAFHSILPKKINKKTDVINSHLVNKDEQAKYEKKSYEYYRDNALKTLNQKDKQFTPKDDSDKIEKDIENTSSKIADLAEKIKKENIKK